MTGPEPNAGSSLERLIQVIAQLRKRCPWMGALTHESLAQYLVEECYELLDALEAPAETTELRSELGDVLLQVVLHARLQEEQGTFAMIDVIEGLTAKMIRRNPHVFDETGRLRESGQVSVAEIEAAWHRLKKREQPSGSSPFASIPSRLPALALAAKSVSRARRDGGSQETPATAQAGDRPSGMSEEEFGEALLGLVTRAVDAGVDPERALRLAVRRYQEAHQPNNPESTSERLEETHVTDGNRPSL